MTKGGTKKKSSAASRRILSLEELIKLSQQKAILWTDMWKKVAQTFEEFPDIAQALARERARVPSFSSRDPFISALRRICWPSDRLPVRHRRALAAIGKSPLGIVRLSLEEARTWSWRSIDGSALANIARWLGRSPMKSIELDTSNELALTARVYDALHTMRFGAFGQNKDLVPVMAAMAQLDKYLSLRTSLVPEGLMALGLFSARRRDSNQAAENFHNAEVWLAEENFEDQEEAREIRVFWSLCRAWAELIMTSDEGKVECLLTEALSAIGPETDPWLALFLHHEAAKSALTASVSRMPNIDGFEVGMDQEMEESDIRTEKFRRLQGMFYDHGTAERDAATRALAHLEAAESLFEEFSTENFSIAHRWLWAHALVHTDPIRGVDLILEAMELATKLGQRNRASLMALDTVYLLCQLSRSTEPTERVQQCIDRVTAVVQKTAQERRRSGLRERAGGEQIPLSPGLRSRIETRD